LVCKQILKRIIWWVYHKEFLNWNTLIQSSYSKLRVNLLKLIKSTGRKLSIYSGMPINLPCFWCKIWLGNYLNLKWLRERLQGKIPTILATKSRSEVQLLSTTHFPLHWLNADRVARAILWLLNIIYRTQLPGPKKDCVVNCPSK